MTLDFSSSNVPISRDTWAPVSPPPSDAPRGGRDAPSDAYSERPPPPRDDDRDGRGDGNGYGGRGGGGGGYGGERRAWLGVDGRRRWVRRGGWDQREVGWEMSLEWGWG
ncbi:hypothetical protein JCM24511_01748 [Saitozyma sp. JCM 24511]|nr:hypothetical protein JCM24511_01748 [Saitozyma sp. JCM 24511]